MEAKLIWLLAAVICIVLFFYFVLPKLNLGHRAGIIFRSVLFASMMTYLAYDFINKDKYSYLVVLAIGSIGFILMVTNMKSKK